MNEVRRNINPRSFQDWRGILCALFTLVSVALDPLYAEAQGLTGAAIHGTVVSSTGLPLSDANVVLTNTRTGSTRELRSSLKGEFVFEVISVAGAYRLDARLIGFRSAALDNIMLNVGDRVALTLIMSDAAAAELPPVLVRATDVGIRDAGSGGASYLVAGDAVRNLPLRDRNVLGLLNHSSHATGGSALSISGQHTRFSAIQLDGGIVNDLMGFSVTPGGSSGARTISLESIQEFRLLVAPFDVRQGGFSGGLINAVTRSGTNRMHGSLLASMSRSELVGPDQAGRRADDFGNVQYAASLGGPIIKDKLHFFLATDLQISSAPFAGPTVQETATGISDSTARRAALVFRDVYGFDPGGPEAPILQSPNADYFLKLTWQPFHGTVVDLSQTVVRARSDALGRTIRNRNDRDGWQLSASGSASNTRTATTRLSATSSFGGGAFTNEFMASIGEVSTNTSSQQQVPLFLVEGDVANNFLAAGSVKGAQITETNQRIVELTDNLSWTKGSHLFTAGTQNQFVRTRESFLLGAWGIWTFRGVDQLEALQPFRYEIALPLRPDGHVAAYSTSMLSGYLQDRWSASSRLTVTGGVRLDIPLFSKPVYNPTLAAIAQLGNINTSEFPSGNTVISPRVGFAYEVGKKRNWLLRGGVGAFAGRPLFAWFSNAFVNTGLEQTLLICTSAEGVPAPTTDIASLPDECVNNQAPGSVVPSINHFTPDFRFQRAIKVSLGADHNLGAGFRLSVDAIRTTTHQTLFAEDVNLRDLGVNSETRTMYGIIAANGAPRPTRIDSSLYGSVVRLGNGSGDRSTSLSVMLQKRWAQGAFASIGYNWSQTDDVMSLAGVSGAFLIQNNPIDGTMQQRNLRRSARDIPHTLVATALIPARTGTTASFFFRMRSGSPYAYTLTGDANGDGTRFNDLFYVPADSDDISLDNPEMFQALDTFIEGQDCLRSQRGRIMRRNSCRNPAVYSLDMRVTQRIWRSREHSVELTADLFNAPNLLNNHWGVVREATSTERLEVIAVSGWDAARSRPRYSVATLGGAAVLPDIRRVSSDPSRWRLQLGARYTF